MQFIVFLSVFVTLLAVSPLKAEALGLFGKNKKDEAKAEQKMPPNTLVPHKALYKINLVSTHSG